MSPTFHVVIPARFASTRLPGKPLADIGGKPMVVRVVERAALSGASEVLVATDHEDVATAVRNHGHTALMTREDHPTFKGAAVELDLYRHVPLEDWILEMEKDVEAREAAKSAT